MENGVTKVCQRKNLVVLLDLFSSYETAHCRLQTVQAYETGIFYSISNKEYNFAFE